MSGICGIVGLDGTPPEEAPLRAMVAAMTHRGPDARNIRRVGACGLGIAQGAEPPVGEYAEQPLTAVQEPPNIPFPDQEPPPTRRATIVYDGAAYNFNDIHGALIAMGHRLRTHSDVETLAYAYLSFGAPNFIQAFRGSFAVAIWDENAAQLILLRDRLGHKPLYYTLAGPDLLFASEVDALLLHPEVSKQPNEAAIPYYLAMGHAPPGETMFAGIYSLPPGHLLTVGLADPTPRVTRYWKTPQAVSGDDPRTVDNIAQDLLAHLLWTVQIQDAASGGLLLDGDLASGVLAALAAEERPNGLVTFSLAEHHSPGVAGVVEHFGTDHEVLPSLTDIPAWLEALLESGSLPIADPKALLTYAAYHHIGQAMPRLAAGLGAQALFVGYWDARLARTAQRLRRLPAPVRRAAQLALQRMPDEMSTARLERLRAVEPIAHLPLAQQHLYWASRVPMAWLAELLSPVQMEGLLATHRSLFVEREEDGSSPPNYVAPVLDVSVRGRLACRTLHHLDMVSTRAYLDVRTPLLDHHLLSYAAAVPTHLKIHGQQRGYILKQAIKPLLPAERLAQLHPAPTPAPVGAWLRGPLQPWLTEVLSQPGLFDTQTVRAMLDAHAKQPPAAGDRLSNGLWALFSLELWLRQHFG